MQLSMMGLPMAEKTSSYTRTHIQGERERERERECVCMCVCDMHMNARMHREIMKHNCAILENLKCVTPHAVYSYIIQYNHKYSKMCRPHVQICHNYTRDGMSILTIIHLLHTSTSINMYCTYTWSMAFRLWWCISTVHTMAVNVYIYTLSYVTCVVCMPAT